MTSYTITVASSDGSGSTTTIAVDSSGGHIRITDVHLHAAAGLTATQLPSIDIELLMQAVTPQPTLAGAAPVATPALTDEPVLTAAAATERTADEDTSTNARDAAASVADMTTPTRTPKSPRRAVRQRRTDEEAVAEPRRPSKVASPRPRRRSRSTSRDNAATTPPQKTPTAPDQASSSEKERAYRRMPDDFATVATNLNSASTIAEHYNVPRHTAQGWLRRLRTATTS